MKAVLPLVPLRSDAGSEEVADGELEAERLFVRQVVEREPPLEAQWAHGGEPAEAEAPRSPYVQQAVGAEARTDLGIESGTACSLAIVRLEIPGVAKVGEDHPLE